MIGEENDAIDVVIGNPSGVVAGTRYTLVLDLNTGIVYQNTDGGTTWAVFAPSGGSSTAATGFTTGDPDGVLTAALGAQLTDTATGVVYQNMNGANVWDPIWIPRRWGYLQFCDSASDTVLLTATTIGAGAVATGTIGEGIHPGLCTITGSVAGADGGVVKLGSSSTALLFGGGKARERIALRIPTLSDGTNNMVVRAGNADILTFADQIDAVYFEYDFATYAEHNWRLCASSNSTRTKTTTGIAAVASSTTMTTLELTVNAAGTSLTGKVNDVAVPTPVTTNIPTAAGRVTGGPALIGLKQLGAGALSVVGDWLDISLVLSSKR